MCVSRTVPIDTQLSHLTQSHVMQRLHKNNTEAYKMINFEEELKKFRPSLEADEAEKAVINNNSPDMTDLFYKMIEDVDLHMVKQRNS